MSETENKNNLKCGNTNGNENMTIAVEIHVSNCKLSKPRLPPPPPPKKKTNQKNKERQKFRASASTGFELMASFFRARYHISVLLKFIFYDLM